MTARWRCRETWQQVWAVGGEIRLWQGCFARRQGLLALLLSLPEGQRPLFHGPQTLVIRPRPRLSTAVFPTMHLLLMQMHRVDGRC
jgi:hypothetical protein